MQRDKKIKQADKLSLSAGFKMCLSFSLSRKRKLNAACQQPGFPHCFSSVVHQDVLPLNLFKIFIHVVADLFISLSSHVCQSHLRADGKGVPLQVHLHICSCPEQIPLCQSDGRDRLRPTSKGAPVAFD